MLGAACFPIQLINYSTFQLCITLIVLFCLPKKEPKKGSRKRKQPVFGGGILLSFCGTVVNISGALIKHAWCCWFSYSTNQLFNLSTLHHPDCSFLLAQKRTKKG